MTGGAAALVAAANSCHGIRTSVAVLARTGARDRQERHRVGRTFPRSPARRVDKSGPSASPVVYSWIA
jgi:hypothetical protein